MLVADCSKKLSAYVVAVAVLVASDLLKLDEETRARLVELTITYLGGQSVVDAVLAWRGPKKA